MGYPENPTYVRCPRKRESRVRLNFGKISTMQHRHRQGQNFQTANSVTDDIGCLSAAEISEINAIASNINSVSGAELAVVCLEDISGFWAKTGNRYTDEERSFEFAKQLMDLWGVGRRQINDGVVIVLMRERRRVETVVGSGLVHVLDDRFVVDELQRSVMLPFFKRGEHGKGLVQAVRAMQARILFEMSTPANMSQHGYGQEQGYGGGMGRYRVNNFKSSQGLTCLSYYCEECGTMGLRSYRGVFRKEDLNTVEGLPEKEVKHILSEFEEHKQKARPGTLRFQISKCKNCGALKVSRIATGGGGTSSSGRSSTRSGGWSAGYSGGSSGGCGGGGSSW
eukprot:jgi/Bigna1/131802/aug1.15_g6510